MKHLLLVILIAVSLLAAAIASGELRTDSEAETAATSGATPPRSPLTARGHVTGLYPGARAAIKVRIRNRSRRALTLTSLRTRPLDAGAGCLARNLRVATVRRKVVIRPRGRRSLRVPVAMSANAADACQGARFPLRFRLRARARRDR